jgi:hypothetical protein
VVAGDDDFEILGQSPRMGKPGAGFAMIDAEGLTLSFEDVTFGGLGQQIRVSARMGDEQSEPTHVMQ